MGLVKELKSTAQDFTTSWEDYGDEIGTDGFNTIGLWLNIVINNTQNVRFRTLARYTDGGYNYLLPSKVKTPSVVNVGEEYHEIIDDIDARRVISFTLDRIVPFIQIQIQAEIVGATAGQILDSKYTLL